MSSQNESFQNILKKIVPTASKLSYSNAEGSETYFIMDMTQNYTNTVKSPYLEAVDRFFCQENKDYSLMFMITDDYNAAVKASMNYLKKALLRQDEHTDSLQVLHVNVNESKYEVKEDEFIFVSGINESNCIDKLNKIVSLKVRYKCVWITKSVFEHGWIYLALRDYDSGIIMVPKLDNGYYIEVCKELLRRKSVRLQNDVSVEYLIEKLRNVYNKYFNEESIAWYLDDAMKTHKLQASESLEVLAKEDFNGFVCFKDSKSLDILQKLPGLTNAKQTIYEQIALNKEAERNNKLHNKRHLFFVGNAGTAKTTVARLYSSIMTSFGESNGVFYEVISNDLMRKYSGSISRPLRELCDCAEGGILFIDESDRFFEEYAYASLKEIINYTDNRNIMVIFSFHKDCFDEYLARDSKLRFLIDNVVEFDDYSNDELWEIAQYIAKEQNYKISSKCRVVLNQYINKRRTDLNFGNAHEVNKLIKSSILEVALRNDKSNIPSKCITVNDMVKACQRIEIQTSSPSKIIGFQKMYH